MWVCVNASCLKGKQSSLCVGGCTCFLPEAISAKTATQRPTPYSSSPMFRSLIAILASNFLNFCELIYQPTAEGRGTHIHTQTLSLMHTRTYAHAHTHTHTNTLSHMCVHTHPHMYTCPHTHAQTRARTDKLNGSLATPKPVSN